LPKVFQEISAALSGLGNFMGANPGRRSRTRFALGYFLSGFQPFQFAAICEIRVRTLRPCAFALKPLRVVHVFRG
jgi:hypothetical protein